MQPKNTKKTDLHGERDVDGGFRYYVQLEEDGGDSTRENEWSYRTECGTLAPSIHGVTATTQRAYRQFLVKRLVFERNSVRRLNLTAAVQSRCFFSVNRFISREFRTVYRLFRLRSLVIMHVSVALRICLLNSTAENCCRR